MLFRSDLQLIGIDVIEAVFLFQVVAEIGETSGQDGRLVSHALENGHQALQPLGDRQVAGDLLHHRNVESPKHESIHKQAWPKYDEEAIKVDEVEVLVEVNGKPKDRIMVCLLYTSTFIGAPISSMLFAFYLYALPLWRLGKAALAERQDA